MVTQTPLHKAAHLLPHAYTPETAKAAATKRTALQRARQSVVADLRNHDTVSRATRDKLGMITKFLVHRVKPGRIKVEDIDDLRTLVNIADTVFAWSAKDAPQNHLHLHDVGKLLAEREREQTVSKPEQDVETQAIPANDGESVTHPPEK